MLQHFLGVSVIERSHTTGSDSDLVPSGMPGASQDATPVGRAVGESGRTERAGASVWMDGAVRAAKDNILVGRISGQICAAAGSQKMEREREWGKVPR